MSWTSFELEGLLLHGRDVGEGPAVLFQHGLGGSEAQVAEVFPDHAGWRRLTLDCRGQDRSPAGDEAAFSIPTFADDALAFADHRGVSSLVAGGISMGAAIALRLAVKHPERVRALVLARPAWLWDAAPDNMRPYAEVAAFLAQPDPASALAGFEASATARMLAREAPDNLASLRGFFQVPDRAKLAALLAAIAADGPGVSEDDVRAIRVPTLVIGHEADHAHPLAFARRLADTIPGARLAVITPKAIDKPRYLGDFRAALTGFLSTLPEPNGDLP